MAPPPVAEWAMRELPDDDDVLPLLFRHLHPSDLQVSSLPLLMEAILMVVLSNILGNCPPSSRLRPMWHWTGQASKVNILSVGLPEQESIASLFRQLDSWA